MEMKNLLVLAVVAVLGFVCTAASSHALNMPPAPPMRTFYRPATFVHMVGRMYHIEKWVVEELGAELIDIVPIFHKGNPAFRVIYRAKGESEATTVVIMAGAGFAHNSIAPVEE
jgi:hypothetical protein